MDTITIILIVLIFALAIVAIVALGRPVSGKLNEAGVEIHTVVDGSRNGASEKKSG